MTQFKGTVATMRELCARKSSQIWSLLDAQALLATNFEQLFTLSQMRKRAKAAGIPCTDRKSELKFAMLGGYSLYPLNEIVEVYLSAAGFAPEFFVGEYDNYVAEILETDSELYKFEPDVIYILPSVRRLGLTENLYIDRITVNGQVLSAATHLLELCETAHRKSKASIIVSNLSLPDFFDPGAFRAKRPGSLWNLTKAFNYELGLAAPPSVQICDMEFLTARCGTASVQDARRWYESKQPYSPGFMLDVARELSHLTASLTRATKKVLVLDLDNTLWGGIVGDDGLEGIELGDTSPRGEAFKAFQSFIKTLIARGVLLGVASKNEDSIAREVFEKHPEMVLRLSDVVSFKANWNPKSDNIAQMAADLKLGLDSFVFVDDNPAEIEIVRQFLPEVSCLLLGKDPSDYVHQLRNSRFFEPLALTDEDAERVKQYKQEEQRQKYSQSITDMSAYLESLQMQGQIQCFTQVDVPRIAQLINKSNQFNLTTRRRTEAQIQTLIESEGYVHFTVRIADRFGSYGLIAAVIGRILASELHIDTWVMSCRVLKRQVEDEIINEIVRLARRHKLERVVGEYIPTARNAMVKNLYGNFGFRALDAADPASPSLIFGLDVDVFERWPSKIELVDK